MPQTDTHADGRTNTMTETWEQWVGQAIDRKFRLLKYLGASERGPVFLTEFGEGEPQKAAIKLLPAEPQTADAQLSQWTQAAALSHPNLLRIFHTGRCQVLGTRMVYAVMECAEEDLSQLLPQRALTPMETGEMLRPVLSALAYLHSKKMVHGHVKPSNIMAVGEQLKISSDGICVSRGTSVGRSKPSAYEAPEVGTRGGSAAGDVWSLGVTLVEVLTQQLPTWEWKGQEEPQLPRSIPAPFGDIARQCLRRDPQRRCTLAEIGARLDPDAPMPVKIRPEVEQAALQPAPVRSPMATEFAMSRAETKPWVDAGESNASPKRSYAIPVIAIIAIAAVAIFAGTKLYQRSAEDVPDAGVPVEQPAPRPKLVPTPASTPKPLETREPAEAVGAKRADASGVAPVISTPEPKPAAKNATGNFVKGSVAHQVLPVASENALNTVRGAVRVGVRVQVDPTGKVAGADFDPAGPSKYFAKLAMNAAREWTFTPAKVDGKNAASEWVLRFEFAQDGVRVTPVPSTR